MKIPSSQGFGDVVAQPRQAARITADTAVAEALQRAGGQVADSASALQAQVSREAKQRKDIEDRTAAARVRTTTINDLADLQDEFSRGIASGELDKTKAAEEWDYRTKQLLDGRTKSLAPDFSGQLDVEFGGMVRKGLNGVRDAVAKRDQVDTRGNLFTLGQEYERMAARDPQRATGEFFAQIDALAPKAGLSLEETAKLKNGFSERVTYNQFRNAGQRAYQSGDPNAVGAVQEQLNGPGGDAMDPKQRAAMDQTLFGWKTSMEAKAEREAEKAEREATKRFNTAKTSLDKGIELAMGGAYLSPEFMADLSTQAAGTGLEPQVKALFASQKEVAGFASLPPDQRAARLNTLRGMRATRGVGVSPEQNEIVLRAERIDDSLRRQVDENPWAAAQSVGVIQQAPQVSMTDGNQAIQAVTQRMASIGDVEAWAGKKVSPLQPDEADQMTRLARALPPDQASTLLGQIGGVVGDADRVAAVAKQMGDKDGTIGLAMSYASSKTTTGRYTAELVLRGEQAIKDKTVKVDGMAESGWKAEITKRVRGAYSNQQAEDQIVQAAFLIAAAKGGDVENAINLATGGIMERNGGKVPLPYGMKEAEFDKRLGAFTPGDFADQVAQRPTNAATAERAAAQEPADQAVYAGGTRIPLTQFVESLPDAQLVHAGQGIYNVRAGNTLITNQAGKRIVVKVGAQ